jgi:hypothetical protein
MSNHSLYYVTLPENYLINIYGEFFKAFAGQWVKYYSSSG